MQGTSLEEVFGSFEVTSSFLNVPNAPTYTDLDRFRPPRFPMMGRVRKPNEDLSGSTLYNIEQQRLLTGLSEALPTLQPGSQQLLDTIEEYKTLKANHKYLSDDMVMFETSIQKIESFEKKYLHEMETYNNALLHTGVLSNDEFNKLQEKTKELHNLQIDYKTKCLSHYKEKLMNVNTTLTQVQMNLAAYTEFIKSGVKEMAGPDVKLNTCSVCLESEVTHCLVPCGHTFCEGCIKKSGQKKCMTCRSDIQKPVKMFF